MPRLIEQPTVIQPIGNKPKWIEEYAGRLNSGHAEVSVARMVSPEGWQEPGQRPDFEEVTVVLKGMLRVESEDGSLDVWAGQAVVTSPGEWVRYSTPEPGGGGVRGGMPAGVLAGHGAPGRYSMSRYLRELQFSLP